MKCFLPDETRITQVRLRTSNLDSVLAFYTDVLGLQALPGAGPSAFLSSSKSQSPLIVLSEDRNALARPPDSTGLFHVALLYPSRAHLAQAYRKLIKAHYTIAGAADHGVSEAIYLSDPDGNGIELYWDRPRDQWPRVNGQIAMSTDPLDLADLVAAAPPTHAVKSRTPMQIGHVHLNVADLDVAERFYSEFLGLSVTQRSYPGALFFAAGGYHHHIGANIWAGKTVAPPDSSGLISFRVEVPVSEILYCLQHRAPLLGYETRSIPKEKAEAMLEIREPYGTWIEVQAQETNVLT